MAYHDIRFELEHGVALITLHRPEQRNAFSGRMGVELGQAYARCDADDDVRAVILTGAGRDFCVGADFSGGADLFVRRGVLPDAYSHWTVPRAIGFARTADLFLTGRHVTGDEAFDLGLASRVCPAAEVLPAALEVARDIAVNTAPLSVALCKRLLWEGRSLGVDEVGRKETALHHVVMDKADALEGVMAFLERRAPRWTLRVSRDWPDPWPE